MVLAFCATALSVVVVVVVAVVVVEVVIVVVGAGVVAFSEPMVLSNGLIDTACKVTHKILHVR